MSAIDNLCVGKVVRQNIPVAPDIYTPGESFSLSFFTETMDDRDKALVIACVIVLVIEVKRRYKHNIRTSSVENLSQLIHTFYYTYINLSLFMTHA